MDTEAEASHAAVQTGSTSYRELSPGFLTLAVMALSLLVDGCNLNPRQSYTALVAPKSSITMSGKEQESFCTAKPQEPAPKPASAPTCPTRVTARPSLASPKTAVQPATAPATPTVIATVRVKSVANQPAAPEPPTIQRTTATPSAPANALVFKGPPRSAASTREPRRQGLVWLVVCFSVIAAAVGIAAVLRLRREATDLPKASDGEPSGSGELALEGAPKAPEAALGE